MMMRHHGQRRRLERRQITRPHYARLPQPMRLLGDWRKRRRQSHACASLIPHIGFPTSRIGSHYADRKILPDTKRGCEKRGCRNEPTMRRRAMPTVRGSRLQLKPASPAARAMQSVRAKFDADGPDAAVAYGRGLGLTDAELTREIACWTSEATAESDPTGIGAGVFTGRPVGIGPTTSRRAPSSRKQLQQVGTPDTAGVGEAGRPFARAVACERGDPVRELRVRPEPDEQLLDPVPAVAVALGALDVEHVELADQITRGHGAVAGHGLISSVPDDAMQPAPAGSSP